MDGKIGNTVRRLSMFLPSDTRHDVLEILLKRYDEKRLAKDLSCTLTSLRGWKEDGSLPDKHMSKVLVLALQNCPETRDLLGETSEEFSRLCKDLSISRDEETNFSRFMNFLDERSKEIVCYFLRNRHASIRELATLIHAATDQDVLTRVRDVINPKAEEIFGKPMLNFEESRIDAFTGDKILFNWWLAEDLPLEEMNDALDIFDEKDHLVVITELPGVREEDIKVDVEGDVLRISADGYLKRIPLFYTVENKVRSTYKNGVLEVRLRKNGSRHR
ncbi:MAG: Hsp20/alpha crystallin family protein [Candidatus Altiarchaeales archaeon]|nr:Hsp20/alpha crystallin family protein [Candidatus Altiarchaeota archaeon]MBU4341258.1 Hsp20/alpha crystallin family protein [Candidatus Altiarchaeota archaeon]MBU4405952.1 Hsp20/alpha crystallin family protein [Candidatus Altiarchaeota archaeon]MCG2782480.1 Hsp20/alpha crystallin family protein [Candidatus Altiarchaeales archaeon]